MRSAKPKDFRSIPTATGAIARLACARMREAGKGIAAVLCGAGLTVDDVDDPTVRLEVRTQIKVLELAAQELQDEFLGFHLARRFDLREIGLLYYVMASSEQLADALRNAERYSGTSNEGIRLHFRSDRATVIALDYRNVDRRSDRHQMEFWLTAVVRICRELTNSRLAPRRLMVRHFRDSTPAEYKSFLASDVAFGADDEFILKGTRCCAFVRSTTNTRRPPHSAQLTLAIVSTKPKRAPSTTLDLRNLKSETCFRSSHIALATPILRARSRIRCAG